MNKGEGFGLGGRTSIRALESRGELIIKIYTVYYSVQLYY